MGESKRGKDSHAPNQSWETRRRIFEYFKKHGAPCMRNESLRGEGNGNRKYVTLLYGRKFNIAIHLSNARCIWTYIYSRDPDGNLDRRILANIDRNNPPAGARFVDCSNGSRRGIKTRNVCKLERDIDWQILRDKDIETLLGDYNWFIEQLRRIDVL